MKRFVKIIVLLFLVFLLIMIRHFEDSLFYDPLLSFFKSDYSNSTIPLLNSAKLFANVTLRFVLNTLISLAILWVVFKDRGIINLSGFLYLVFFIVLILVYSYLLFYSETESFLFLFYVRRFLIQPIFLLVLLPAFYFQKNSH